MFKVARGYVFWGITRQISKKLAVSEGALDSSKALAS
jgi:hypothetical protein